MRVSGALWDACNKFYFEHDWQDTLLMYGGAASGKSKTLARFFVYLLLMQKDVNCFIMRKVGPVLKDSVIADIKDALSDYKVSNYLENKTDRTITLYNGNRFVFRSLDDPEKVKSVDMNYCWFEEATENSLDEYSQLKLRTRRKNSNYMEYKGQKVKCKNFVALSYNPVGRTNWTFKTFFEQEQKDTFIHKSTYRDNPFLGEREVNNIEKMKLLNPDYYEIYGKGNYGLLKGQVYTNFEIIKPLGLKWDDVIYGIDFGFNNPMAVAMIGVYDNEFYIVDEWYKTHQTTGDLINHLNTMDIRPYANIYCDSAEPDRLEELKRAGFNVYPAWKGKNSVKDGIDKLKQIKLKIWNRCYNTIQEINSYKWKEDKDGNTLEEPEKSNDHLMDAIRYAITSYLGTDNNIYVAPTKDHLSSKFKGFPK